MSLKATGSAYSSQQVLAFVQQEQKAGRLSARDAAGFEAGSGSISLSRLQQQCQGYPGLERALQRFIDTQDKLRLSSGSKQSYEFSRQARLPDSFGAGLIAGAVAVGQQAAEDKQAGRQMLAALADQTISDWQQLRGGSNLNVVLGNTAREAEDLAAVLNLGAGELQAHLPAQDLKLDQGQNFIYANLICAQPDALQKLLHELNAFRNGSLGPPGPEAQGVLKRFGLRIKEGKLYNLMNQQALAGPAVNSLIATAVSLQRVQQAVSHGQPSPEVRATAALRHNLALALRASVQLSQARGRLDTRVAALEQAGLRLASASRALTDSTIALDSKRQALATRQHEVAQINGGLTVLSGMIGNLAGLPTLASENAPARQTGSAAASDAPGSDAAGTVTPQPVIRPASPAQISEFNQAFAPLGLELRAAGPQGLEFRVDARQVDAEEFARETRLRANRAKIGLDMLAGEVIQLSQTVAARVDGVHRAQAEVSAADQAVDQASNDYATARDALETQVHLSESSQADPDLPPELRAAAAPLLAATQAQLARAAAEEPARQARLAAVRAQCDRIVADSRELVQNATQVLSRASRELEGYKLLLASLGDWAQRLHSLIDDLVKLPPGQLTSARIEQALHQLMDAADRLQARLSLTPASDTQALQDLARDTEAALSTSRKLFKLLDQAQAGKQALNQRLSRDHLSRLKDNSAYHSQKLEALRERSHAEMGAVLAASLKQVRGDLFVTQTLLAS